MVAVVSVLSVATVALGFVGHVVSFVAEFVMSDVGEVAVVVAMLCCSGVVVNVAKSET